MEGGAIWQRIIKKKKELKLPRRQKEYFEEKEDFLFFLLRIALEVAAPVYPQLPESPYMRRKIVIF